MKFWRERSRREGAGRRKVKREKGIGAERKYFWGGAKWTSLVHLGELFEDALLEVSHRAREGKREGGIEGQKDGGTQYRVQGTEWA